MPEIPIRNARSGMVLAEPATDLLGNPLFEAGTVLKDDDIRTLKAWGVASVLVDADSVSSGGAAARSSRRRRRTTRLLRQSDAPPRAAETGAAASSRRNGPKTYAERREALEVMFRPHVKNPLMQNIRRIAEHQLERRFAGES